MAHINIRRRHHLPIPEVRARVEQLARELKEKFRSDYAWNGDSLTFVRPGASGTIEIDADSVEIDVRLSLFLAPMKETIEDVIHKRIDVAFPEGTVGKMA